MTGISATRVTCLSKAQKKEKREREGSGRSNKPNYLAKSDPVTGVSVARMARDTRQRPHHVPADKVVFRNNMRQIRLLRNARSIDILSVKTQEYVRSEIIDLPRFAHNDFLPFLQVSLQNAWHAYFRIEFNFFWSCAEVKSTRNADWLLLARQTVNFDNAACELRIVADTSGAILAPLELLATV